MRMRNTGLAMVLGLALAPLAVAQEQQPAPKPEEKKPPKKARKVWTQDDIPSLRKPSDEYAERKAAEEATAKAATGQQAGAEAAQKPPQAEVEDFLPKTVAEADARIAEKKDEMRFQSERIAQLRAQYFDASGEERDQLAARVEQETKLLEEAQAELKALEGRREELSAKPAPTALPKPRPPQPAPTQGRNPVPSSTRWLAISWPAARLLQM